MIRISPVLVMLLAATVTLAALAANRWESRAAMPTPRSGHGWTTFQGRIYVAGGEVRNSHMDAIFRDVEVFEFAGR